MGGARLRDKQELCKRDDHGRPTTLNVAYDETNSIVYTQDQLPNEGALYSFPLPVAAR